MKMTVLYLKDCGHAMAACTRAALSEPASDEVKGLAGEALLVRGFNLLPANTYNGTQFSIPATALAALTLERNEDQLLTPRAYAVVEQERLELPPAAAAPQPEIRAGDATTLYVDLNADVLAEQHIAINVVPVSGTTGQSEFFQSVFKPGSPTVQEVSFSMGAPLNGAYDILVLMAGRRPAVWHLTVP